MTNRFLEIWKRPSARGDDLEDLIPILDALPKFGYYRGWATEFEYAVFQGEVWEVHNLKVLYNRVFKRLWDTHRSEVLAYSDSRDDGPIFVTEEPNCQFDALPGSHYAILVGHAHIEIPQRIVENTQTGRAVVLTEPLRWGMRLSVIDVDLRRGTHGWEVKKVASQVLNSNTVAEDPKIVRLIQTAHNKVLNYVNSVIGTSMQPMSAATARYEDTAALDFINYVQAHAITRAMVGGPYAGLPVLSIAAPFNRNAAIPQGDVTVRDVAGLYIFDNTLRAVLMTGTQVKEYLEFSANYFKPVAGTGPFPPDSVTNAPTPSAPNGTPDYNYDIIGGFTASLTYAIDLAKPPGSRIIDLSYAGQPIDPAASFVVAINNYRASGGGNFPHTAGNPRVYDAQEEIRQLIIDWVTANGVTDPAQFHTVDWSLTYNGAPIQISS